MDRSVLRASAGDGADTVRIANPAIRARHSDFTAELLAMREISLASRWKRRTTQLVPAFLTAQQRSHVFCDWSARFIDERDADHICRAWRSERHTSCYQDAIARFDETFFKSDAACLAHHVREIFRIAC